MGNGSKGRIQSAGSVRAYQHVQTNCAAKFVYPRGLCSDASYEVSLTDLKGDKKDRMQKQVLTGAALMHGGLRLPGADSDYAAWQISSKSCEPDVSTFRKSFDS